MTLTPREREVVLLAAGGARVKSIADALAVVPKTVEMHIYKARLKLKLKSNRQLIRHVRTGAAL